MKTTMKILTLLMLSVIFASCGKDAPAPETGTFMNTYTYGEVIKGLSGQKVTTTEVVVPISETVKNTAYTTYANYISNIQYQNAGSMIVISGLPAGVTLAGFTLYINGDTYLLGDVTSLNNSFSGDSDVNFLSKNVSKLLSSRNLKVSMSFTPSGDVLAAQNVKLNLTYAAKYSYSK